MVGGRIRLSLAEAHFLLLFNWSLKKIILSCYENTNMKIVLIQMYQESLIPF